MDEKYKKDLITLRDDLINTYAVYHERVTILIKLIEFNIKGEKIDIKAKVIKPLDKNRAERNRLYKRLISKDYFNFGISYLSLKKSSLNNKREKIRGYSSFTLWLDPELALFVLNNDDKVTRQIPEYILYGKDWQVLK